MLANKRKSLIAATAAFWFGLGDAKADDPPEPVSPTGDMVPQDAACPAEDATASSQPLPEPDPAFRPAPATNHDPLTPATHFIDGDHLQTVNPGVHNDTHLSFHGTATLPERHHGIEIVNRAAASGGHSILIGKNAVVRVQSAWAVGFITGGNAGDLVAVNRGHLEVHGSGRGIRAVSHNGSGNIRIVNYGTIQVTGFADESRGRPDIRLVVASINKGAAPHDPTHFVEAINMPAGQLIATGDFNGRTDGLKAETGGSQLTRMINYGRIDLSGAEARGISAQSLWGHAQGYNFGQITVQGNTAMGLHADNCAPWPLPGNRCHDALHEIVPNEAKRVPGDVYARNYEYGTIAARGGRRAFGIQTFNTQAGRIFAINEGDLTVAGSRWGHGIWAEGFFLARRHAPKDMEQVPWYPDTSHHDAIYAANTGRIHADSEEAHGIHAIHHRSGSIAASNAGTINVQGPAAVGILASALGAMVPAPSCPTLADGTLPDSLCAHRIYRVGHVEVRNSGDIVAGGDNGIGIDASSEGGDVSIFHSGTIRASRIGIRVATQGAGTLRMVVEGAIDAPIPFVGTLADAPASTFSPPLAQTQASLNRGLLSFANAPVWPRAAARPTNALFYVERDRIGSLRLGWRGTSGFANLDLFAHHALHTAAGWRVAGGKHFALGGRALTLAVLLGTGETRAAISQVLGVRRFQQRGVALKLGWLGASVFRSTFQTATYVRRPGFALDLREPDSTAWQFRLGSGISLGYSGKLHAYLAMDRIARGATGYGGGLKFAPSLPLR